MENSSSRKEVGLMVAAADWRRCALAYAYKNAIQKLKILINIERRKIKTTSRKVFHKPQLPAQQLKIADLLPSAQLLNACTYETEINWLIDFLRKAICAQQRNTGLGTQQLQPILQALLQQIVQRRQQRQLQAALQKQLSTLKRQLEEQQQTYKQRLKATEERLSDLRHELKVMCHVHDLEHRLVVRWERTRCEQVRLICEQSETTLRERIAHFRKKTDAERRFICEIDAYNAKECEQLRDQIQELQHRFSRELHKMEAANLDQQQKILKLAKTRERNDLIYAQQREYVAQYLAEKAEEERLIALELHRIESAVRIQAWWRGTMVRRGLGPYKKKSKKGRGKGQGKAK